MLARDSAPHATLHTAGGRPAQLSSPGSYSRCGVFWQRKRTALRRTEFRSHQGGSAHDEWAFDDEARARLRCFGTSGSGVGGRGWLFEQSTTRKGPNPGERSQAACLRTGARRERIRSA
jgi:hypothetical protein